MEYIHGIDGRQFVIVYDFMTHDLHLKGSELVLYARIFGFASIGKAFFESKAGSAMFCGISRRAAFDVVKRLKKRGLIEEIEPYKEAAHIGSKYYIPCTSPLSAIGIFMNTEAIRNHHSCSDEETAYATSSPGEETSPLSSEETSLVGKEDSEETSPSLMQFLHPISKIDNKDFI